MQYSSGQMYSSNPYQGPPVYPGPPNAGFYPAPQGHVVPVYGHSDTGGFEPHYGSQYGHQNFGFVLGQEEYYRQAPVYNPSAPVIMEEINIAPLQQTAQYTTNRGTITRPEVSVVNDEDGEDDYFCLRCLIYLVGIIAFGVMGFTIYYVFFK